MLQLHRLYGRCSSRRTGGLGLLLFLFPCHSNFRCRPVETSLSLPNGDFQCESGEPVDSEEDRLLLSGHVANYLSNRKTVAPATLFMTTTL